MRRLRHINFKWYYGNRLRLAGAVDRQIDEYVRLGFLSGRTKNVL